MASATKTIRQPLSYPSAHGAWFVATKSLFNQTAAFFFGCIQEHPGLLALSAKDAITALERLTHTTGANPHPVMPLCEPLPKGRERLQ